LHSNTDTKVLPRTKSSKILKSKETENNKKKIQTVVYGKRRNQRIGKLPDSIEKNVHLSMFKASLSFPNKRRKKFNKPS